MNITVKVDIDPQKIMELHKLGKDGAAWQYAGERFKFYCKDYVPWDTGALADRLCDVESDGSGATVKYNAPYAHYQYYGKTMGPSFMTDAGWRSYKKPHKKHYTGGSLTYASGRSKEWDKKMMAAKKQDLMDDIANYVGGMAK